jgi:hypothetical protein
MGRNVHSYCQQNIKFFFVLMIKNMHVFTKATDIKIMHMNRVMISSYLSPWDLKIYLRTTIDKSLKRYLRTTID